MTENCKSCGLPKARHANLRYPFCPEGWAIFCCELCGSEFLVKQVAENCCLLQKTTKLLRETTRERDEA